ncbi:hypothetical protein C8Q80DRAFT_1097925 [Daedaleopsis nitida]|nr:hypothetical protein C8Q80DRAFT_1097925 [Daedaleopsis nitida]
MLRQSSPDIEKSLLYQVAFVDLMASLWEDDSRTRNRTIWSPMPWSQISLQEPVATKPADSIPANQLPTGEALDAYGDDDLLVRMPRSTYGYPLDIPWSGKPHDGYPFCFNLSSYTKIRRAANASLRDDAALWLSAMTSGLLEAVVSMKIPEELFVVAGPEEGTFILSGSRMLRLMAVWVPFMQAYPWSSPEARRFRGRQVAFLLQRALGAIDEGMRRGLSIFIRAGYPEDEVTEIVGAVSMMVVVLSGNACSVWDDLPEMQEILKETRNTQRNLYTAAAETCQQKMLRAGWCPYVVQSQFMSVGGLLSLISNFARMKPHVRADPNEHKSCTNHSCVFYDIGDSDHYVPRHVRPDCDCEFLKPPIEDIARILDDRDGTAIPVVTFDGQTLGVEPAVVGSYLAISHVWADGMGSTSEVGLPRCQVARIAALAQELVPHTGAFWVDSLCVPEAKRLRKHAIKLMAKTYKHASSVLVIDRDIRAACSRAQTWETNLLRIATSGWVRRIWTLQEGMLASRLYFDFADGPVDISEEVDKLARELADSRDRDGKKIAASFELLFSELFKPHVPLLAFRADRKGDTEHKYSLNEVIWLLQNRRTTKHEDETIAISSLLPLDVEALLAISGPDAAEKRMKAALIQMRQVSRQMALLPVPKLSLPGFHWAPKSLAQTYDRGKLDAANAATCTEDGLLGTYTIAWFEMALPVPPECADGSQQTLHLLVSHRPSQKTFSLDLHCPMRLSTFDSLIFVDAVIPTDSGALCAVVLRGKGMPAEDGQGAMEAVRCEYVAPGNISPLAWRSDELERNTVDRPVLLGELREMRVQLT